MFFDHKWSELTGSEKDQAKDKFGSKQSWQDAKAAAGYRAHHSANPGAVTGGSTLTNGATFGDQFTGPTVGPQQPSTPPPVTTTQPPTTGGTKPPPTSVGGGVPGTEFQFQGPADKPKPGDQAAGGVGPAVPETWSPPKDKDKDKDKDSGPGFTFEYQGPADIPKGGDKVPDGAYGPDIPDDYELPKGAESQYTGPKGGYQGPTYITTGGTPGNSQGGSGGSATIAEGAIQINLGDMMSGGGGEQTEVGYLGGGGAGLSKFDPGAFMGGLQASLPTWKGGGKAQATGMFNNRMNLGRN